MRIFGTLWDVPACDGADIVETPVGDACGHCTLPITAGDRGYIIPKPLPDDSWQPEPWHRECFFRRTYGSLAHIRGEGTCASGHDDAVNAPRSPEELRAEALAVWQLVMT